MDFMTSSVHTDARDCRNRSHFNWPSCSRQAGQTRHAGLSSRTRFHRPGKGPRADPTGPPAKHRRRLSLNYDISIRPNRTGKTPANRGAVEYVFSRLANIRRESPDVFVYADTTTHSFMRIQVGRLDPVESIRVTIPCASLRSDGGSVLRLCFRIADQLGWGILDEQLGGYIERDAIPDVLKRYEHAGETMTEFLDRQPAGKARFPDLYRFHLRTHSRLGMLGSMGLAAVVAGFVIIRLDAPPISFLWVSVAMFAGLISVKALVQSLRRTRQRRNSVRGNPM